MRQLAFLLLVSIGLGCGAAGPNNASTKIIVATSVPPHAWLIERIGGDSVEVHTVLRPGESPTTHQPSDLQVSRVLSGRVFFRSGVPFESSAWFRALEGHLEIVDLRDGVSTRTMDTHTHGGQAAEDSDHHLRLAVDPHIWLSPRRLVVQANHVAETLKRLDPAHETDYDTRLSPPNSENSTPGSRTPWLPIEAGPLSSFTHRGDILPMTMVFARSPSRPRARSRPTPNSPGFKRRPNRSVSL